MHVTTYTPRFGLKPYRRSDVFDDFFAPFNSVFEDVSAGGLHPAVDIYEKDEKLVFEVELPGIEKENIRVDVKGRRLTIAGEHTSDEESKENGHYRRERRFGKFERSFKLPFDSTEDLIDASYKNGILVLKVDKPEEQKPKQITIN
jgi:HSP20 family protein